MPSFAAELFDMPTAEEAELDEAAEAPDDLILLDEEQTAWLLERISKRTVVLTAPPDRELHVRLVSEGRSRTDTLLLCGESVLFVYADGDLNYQVRTSAEELLEVFGLDG